MGRKKAYDREALVAQAVEIFRDHGFAGTSAQMLVEALGVNRYSLYAEFGSKQGLFDAALQRYDEEWVQKRFGPLTESDAGIAEVRGILEFYAAASGGPADGRGCLLCNTAVELGPNDPGGGGFVQRYFRRLSTAFETALRNAQRRDELPANVDPKREASFFTANVLGLFVMLRAKAPAAVVRDAAHVAIDHLDRLCAEA